MKIYTKTGDTGGTSLVGGRRIAKDDIRVCAYGTVDELSAQAALLRDMMKEREAELGIYRGDLLEILKTLMTIEALLACDAESIAKVAPLHDDRVDFLEKRIDEMSVGLPAVKYFLLPGGNPLVSMSHLCRTVCRRAEREAVAASRQFCASEEVLRYLNRLSDYFYTLARKLSAELNVEEVYWTAEK